MRTELQIGLRNLARRRTRSALTFLMLLGGTLLIVFTTGLADGAYGTMKAVATRTYTGHFQVLGDRFFEKPTLYKTVQSPGEVIRALSARREVVAVAPRVESMGLMAQEKHTTGVMLVGIDPEAEAKVTTLSTYLSEGTWLTGTVTPTATGEKKPVLIGSGVARRLKAKVGDEVAFVSQGADGSIAADLFEVEGIVKSGLDDVDANIVFTRIGDAQSLLVMDGKVQRIVGLIRDIDGLASFQRDMPMANGNVLKTWEELLPSLASTISSDLQTTRTLLLIIMLVALLGVVNTMMMAVFERTREFGVLLALGTSPGRIVLQTLFEAFWLSFAGVAVGTMLGAAANIVGGKYGIPAGKAAVEFGGVRLDVFHPQNNVTGTLVFPALILLCGVLAGVLPAMRAARLDPVTAIREG